LWNIEDTTTKGRKHKRIGDRGSWGRSSCVICGAEDVKRHGIREIEKLRKEEQKG